MEPTNKVTEQSAEEIDAPGNDPDVDVCMKNRPSNLPLEAPRRGDAARRRPGKAASGLLIWSKVFLTNIAMYRL